jgi:hypothetical protein
MLNHCNIAKVVAVTINSCILCFLLLYKSRFYFISRAARAIEPRLSHRQRASTDPTHNRDPYGLHNLGFSLVKIGVDKQWHLSYFVK